MFCYRCGKEIGNAEGTCKYCGNTDFPVYESNYMQDDVVRFLVQNASSSDPNAKEVTDSSEQNQGVSEYPLKDKTKIWKVICFIEAIAFSCVTGLFGANLFMQNDNRDDMDHNNSIIETTQSEDSNMTTATTATTVTTTTDTTTSSAATTAAENVTENNNEPDYETDLVDRLNKLNELGNDDPASSQAQGVDSISIKRENELDLYTLYYDSSETIGQVEIDEENGITWSYEEINDDQSTIILNWNTDDYGIEMTYSYDGNIKGKKFESTDNEHTYHAYIESVDASDKASEVCLMLFYGNGQQEGPEIYLLIDGNIYEIKCNMINEN